MAKLPTVITKFMALEPEPSYNKYEPSAGRPVK